MAERFKLTDEERKQLLSSRQPKLNHRVGWARTYLKKAGLLEPTTRGYFRITHRGLDVLSRNPERIDVEFLEQFPEFLEFKAPSRLGQNDDEQISSKKPSTSTPEELLDDAYQRLRESLAAELLSMVKQCSPEFFEKVVIDTLVKIGYGGTRQDAGQARMDLAEGESLEVINGSSRERYGSVQIQTGSYSVVRKSSQEVSFTEKITPVGELQASMLARVSGFVTGPGEVWEFQREDIRCGRVANIYISDASGRIKVVLWGDHVQLLDGLELGFRAELYDGLVKSGWNYELEICCGWRTRITFVPPEKSS
jgi:hypothetical protein